MQDGYIFSDTIADNIALGDGAVDDHRLRAAASTANIHEFIESLPLGYKTRIGAQGHGLSEGQKQRILIARAVYKDPDYFFFDEATNALDSTNEAEIMMKLARCFSDRTVVVAAHRLSTVRHADQIVVLDRGGVVEIGNHAGLMERRGAYHDLVKDQLS
jgi:ATP-binding cassette subfamily B protein